MSDTAFLCSLLRDAAKEFRASIAYTSMMSVLCDVSTPLSDQKFGSRAGCLQPDSVIFCFMNPRSVQSITSRIKKCKVDLH